MTGSTGSGRTLTVHQGVTFRPFKAIPGPPLPDRERRPITRPHVSERTEPRFTCERENLTSRIFARLPANGTRSPRSGNNGKRDKSFPGDRGKGLAAIDSHEHGGTCSNVALRAGSPSNYSRFARFPRFVRHCLCLDLNVDSMLALNKNVGQKKGRGGEREGKEIAVKKSRGNYLISPPALAVFRYSKIHTVWK